MDCGGFAGLCVRVEIPEQLIEVIAARAAELVQHEIVGRIGSRELLNVAEAADYLRCAPQRIYELRSSGRLPQTREGGRAIIRRRDLDALIAGAARVV
ncbi:MAG: Helix-turn-helix domain [Gaiellaceae bacterium]|jgi:excisionase family DNA binding protein|nr:Helix-turn-helix domain [Gaiellaceae bacterium]